MGAQPHPEDFDGEPVRRATPASQQEDGLYRYVPVPPAGYDDDGYLIEDDKPQPSVDHHRQTAHWREALALRLPAATVCSNLTVHYREGDRCAAIVPDLFVALRAPPLEERTSYKLWQYPLPELVMEMLAEDSAKADVGSKQYTYAYLGVTEYWLFDPLGLQLSTPLVGYRLDAGGATGRSPRTPRAGTAGCWAWTCTLTPASCASAIRRRARTCGPLTTTLDNPSAPASVGERRRARRPRP